MVDLQNLILEMVARGTELHRVMDRLCRETETLAPATYCSVLSVDHDGLLHTLAAPSLPDNFSQAIEGLAIGPQVGSCGTAAFRRHEVVVTDIEQDWLWEPFRAAPIPQDVVACWSTPIISDDRVIGTFAFYYREKRGPTALERDIVGRCVDLCRIALERDHRLHEHQRLLTTDNLTGLQNRHRFEEVVTSPGPHRVALLLIDIDDLKTVNDMFGHAIGDCLIQILAERIGNIAGATRTFRLGGDEMAILAAEDELQPLADEIISIVREPADCLGNILMPSVTIGAAVRSAEDRSGALMRQNADLALYHGKEGGRGTLTVYSPDLRTRMQKRLRAVGQLRAALQEQRVKTHYQPIIDLETGTVRGFEALVRIYDRDGRIISACEFQDAFVDARNAVEVTRQMLRTVAGDVRRWQDAGFAVPRVAVNLSPLDFAHGKLVAEVREIFSSAGAPLDRLALEVTESVYLGNREVLIQRQIEGLRRLGVRLALDDFGTGFASLTHLLFTPVDTLKIDKSFVETLGRDGDADSGGAAVINGLMRMAEKLKISVVAEGVETDGQRARLRALGCKLGQGFLFAAALPAAEVESMLSSVRSPSPRWRRASND